MDETGSESGLAKAAHQLQDAAGAVVGMMSASTAGAQDPEAFARNAAISSLYEIEAGRLAFERTTSSDILELARVLVVDHQRMAAAMAHKVPAMGAPELDQRRQGMLDHLRAASPEDFDDRFLDQQQAAHEEAVTLHQGFIRHADGGPLLGLASAALAGLKQHLEIVEGLKAGLPFRTAAATVGDSRLDRKSGAEDRWRLAREPDGAGVASPQNP